VIAEVAQLEEALEMKPVGSEKEIAAEGSSFEIVDASSLEKKEAE